MKSTKTLDMTPIVLTFTYILIDIRTTPYVCLNMSLVPLKVSLIALSEFVIPVDIRIPSLNRLSLFLTHATSGFFLNIDLSDFYFIYFYSNSSSCIGSIIALRYVSMGATRTFRI